MPLNICMKHFLKCLRNKFLEKHCFYKVTITDTILYLMQKKKEKKRKKKKKVLGTEWFKTKRILPAYLYIKMLFRTPV
ncbi:hypothetical protein KUTeg_022085 [Tegillarca granosa]|uniref:Uncharacterized protein n=1 Tax=Tegillarca granosa TaxID=220873 RepID=A0ABQ9E9S5_TEGGR|nr:hypothetical protein KUTeg_022085 [Tegillarca granosa]